MGFLDDTTVEQTGGGHIEVDNVTPVMGCGFWRIPFLGASLEQHKKVPETDKRKRSNDLD